MRQRTSINYEKSYRWWRGEQNRLRKISRRKEALQIMRGTSWEVILRFKEAQAMLKLMYRRASAREQSRVNNTNLVKRDGVWQQRAFQILNVPTRHGTIQFSTTTRGMDTQRLRKQRNGVRTVQVHMAWDSINYDCPSDVIAQETNEDIATYLSDTLKWGHNQHTPDPVLPHNSVGKLNGIGKKRKKDDAYWNERMPAGLSPEEQNLFKSQ